MMSPPDVLNQRLIDELMQRGTISSAAMEAGFRGVLRHHFLPEVALDEVYQDHSIGTKVLDDTLVSSSSQPTMMAIMLEQLDLQPGHNVLEIGAGTGYNAAIMAHMVGETGTVVSIDIDQDIVDDARAHLQAAGYPQVLAVCGDGGYGYSAAGPYDRIILTVGADDIMPAWREQLKDGGRLVMPLALRGGQLSVAYEKRADHFASDSVRSCGFIRLRGAFAAQQNELFPLGPEPGLSMLMASGEMPTTPETIYRWLQGPYSVSESQNAATPIDASEGLEEWVLLREGPVCILRASGEIAVERVFPPLTVFQGNNFIRTVGLVSTTGLALLAQPEEAAEQFLVQVYQFGDDDTLVDQLLASVNQWAEAGRPLVREMQIRAYPRGANPAASRKILVKTCYTDFVVDYASGGRSPVYEV